MMAVAEHFYRNSEVYDAAICFQNIWLASYLHNAHCGDKLQALELATRKCVEMIACNSAVGCLLLQEKPCK